MGIRGDLQNLIEWMVRDGKSGDEILRVILEELTCGDFLSKLHKHGHDLNAFIGSIEALKHFCLFQKDEAA